MGSFLRPRLESLEGRETPVIVSFKGIISVPNIVVFPPGDTDVPPTPAPPAPPPTTTPVTTPTTPVTP